MATTTKRNLPPESALWGREVERRLSVLELSASNLSTAVNVNNTRIGSILTTQRELTSAQADLTATQAFLLSQIAVAQQHRTTLFYTPAGSNTHYHDFDPAADALVTFTTSSTGRAIVGFGAAALSSYCERMTLATGLIVEYLDTTTGIWTMTGQELTISANAPTATYVYNELRTPYTQAVIDFIPNTECSLRTRRTSDVTELATPSAGTSTWINPHIVVTKIGM